MRTYLLITLILAGCAASIPTDAPRGSSAVIVHTDLSREEAFQTAGRILGERGYPVQSSDLGSGTISTDYRNLGFSGVSLSDVLVRVTATISGDPAIVRFTGQIKLSSSDTPSPAEARGTSRSPVRHAWAEVEAVAALMGRPVTYE